MTATIQTPIDAATVDTPTPADASFAVVGIGASTGGVAALERFFDKLPTAPGSAFIVTLNLAASHQRRVVEMLERRADLTVTPVDAAVPIAVDHVYLVAPTHELAIGDGWLRIGERAPAHARQVAIDPFFRTLAEAYGSRAFAVILSGAGSDGAAGLRSVKEHGGVSFAQHPDEAECGDMPQAAISAGVVDFVVPAGEMPARIVALKGNAERIARAPATETPAQDAETDADEGAFTDILATLRSRTRHDFRQYKRGSILRRIERRMQLNAVARLTEYRDFLREHGEETAPLLQDLLVGVTHFFRDASAFEALGKTLSALVARRGPSEPIRAWVPGCATGEEAYSVAIVLREICSALNRDNEIQVFATDIDERAIAVARSGSYPAAITFDLSPGRLRRFFRKEGERFHVTKEIRDSVLFAAHNVLRDAPFSRLDLVCCRNLLLCLKRDAQVGALQTFRFGLRPDGYLLLGASESPNAAGGLFVPIDQAARLFQPGTADGIGKRADARRGPALPPSPAGLPGDAVRTRSYGDIHRAALARFASPSVLVDAHHHILHLSEGVGRFLQHASGAPSLDLFDNADPSLKVELRSALTKRMQTGGEVVVRDIRVGRGERWFDVDLFVRPCPDGEGFDGLTLIVFVERPVRPEDGVEDGASEPASVRRLQGTVRELRSQLQDTIAQANATAEDLTSSVEQLQTINEELRSAGEERETNAEELQSMNEELVLANDELKTRFDERSAVNDDLQHLIASTGLAVVFVDASLRIKRFTPRATALFNLIPADIGRPLSDVKHRLDGIDPAEVAQTVLRTRATFEEEVHASDGRSYLARVTPFLTAADRLEGAVLTYVDVTARNGAEDASRRGPERIDPAAAAIDEFVVVALDDDGAIRSWNAGAARAFGFTAAEMTGRDFASLFSPEERTDQAPARQLQVARENGGATDERWHVRKDGTRFFFSGVVNTVRGASDAGFVRIGRDMTGSTLLDAMHEKAGRSEVEAADRLKDQFLAVMSHELKHPLNLIHVNAELLARAPEVRDVATVARAAENIRQAVADQARIVDDLLDLSRARTGKMALLLTEMRLDAIVRRIFDAAQKDAAARKVRMTIETSKEELTIRGDQVRLEQIAWNLVSNALKFTPEGGTIRLRLRRDGDDALLEVSDDGRGIAAEFLPLVFSMFQQERRTYAQGHGGLGIGLALVKELAEAQGGRVGVVSPGVGHGSTFSVRMPLVATARHRDDASSGDANPLEGLRVALVDDSRDILDIMSALIEYEGAAVVSFDNGADALRHLRDERFDLLISDIGMPEMDGYALVDEVRKLPGLGDLPTVALTGFGRATDMQRALSVGYDAHLSKPTSMEDLKAVLARLGVHRR